MRSLVLGLMLAPLALVGCSSTDTMGRIVGSWQGENVDTVVRQWGIPDRQYKTASGSTIYEWGSGTSAALPTISTTTGSVSSTGYVQATTFSSPSYISDTCTRQLTADQSGRIVDGAWQGGDCCVMAIAGRCASWLNPRR